MAVVYSTTLKNTRMDAITTAIGSGGKLVIGTSALSGATGVLVTITLNTAAFGASANGVITLGQSPALSGTAGATGAPALAELRTSGDVVVVSGLTVGAGGSNIVLSTGAANINSGATVTASGTLTHG
jgi:hypothetical protein